MKVVIVDYGLGNLRSVLGAFESFGASAVLSSKADDIASASRLVLPGVGAFADGMQGLKTLNLEAPIREYCASGRPFLGICLGMQMLFDEAFEFGQHKGLGIIPGKVVKIPDCGTDGTPHKIPHVGWNSLVYPAENSSRPWDGTPLADVKVNASAYFVHSYTCVPEDPQHRLADCFYNGQLILAACRKGSVFGCQFHPEKSAHAGLSMLKAFCKLAS